LDPKAANPEKSVVAITPAYQYLLKTHRRYIAKLVFLPRQNLAENAPHNLSRARLGQIVDCVNGLEKRSQVSLEGSIQA
jgi:hypothetical protein